MCVWNLHTIQLPTPITFDDEEVSPRVLAPPSSCFF